MKYLTPILGLLLLCLSPMYAQPLYRLLGEGIDYQRIETVMAGKPQVINVVTVDMSNPSVKVTAALSKDVVILDDATKGRETIPSLTARKNAVVGINGDFFPFTGDPLNMCVIDGDYISEPAYRRLVFGITAKNQVVFGIPSWSGSVGMPDGTSIKLTGINRPAGPNDCILYSSQYGPSISAKYPMKVLNLSGTANKLSPGSYTLTVDSLTDVFPTSTSTTCWQLGISGAAASTLDNSIIGKQISVQFSIVPPVESRMSPRANANAHEDAWNNLRWAVGGGPWLVCDGRVYVDSDVQGFKDDVSKSRSPRTAIGVDASGRLLVVTVDGRQAKSAGMTLTELASYMTSIGAVYAMNFDGGGSSTMALFGGRLANVPSDPSPRAVANGILIYSNPYTLQPLSALTVSPGSIEVKAGQQVEFSLVGYDVPEPVGGDVIWTMTNAVGKINGNGVFTAERPGDAYINAYYDNRSYRAMITVSP